MDPAEFHIAKAGRVEWVSVSEFPRFLKFCVVNSGINNNSGSRLPVCW